MKLKRLDNWKDDKKLDCLLFFALRLRELVFDYTLDTFKYPALNSTANCKETLELIKQIELNQGSEKSLDPVISELLWKIKDDLVIKDLVGEDKKYYTNFGDLNDLKPIQLKLELLYNKIQPQKYSRASERLLKELVIENRQKGKINELCSNYVSSLINTGFSQSYIYMQINHHFFSKNEISDTDTLDVFFRLFDQVNKEYRVIIKCSSLLNEIKKSTFAFNCQIERKISKELIDLDQKNYLTSKRRNESYFIANNITALDPVSAKLEAERRINKLSKLFVFYHHKQHPTWETKSLVIEANSNVTFLLDEKVSPMSKGHDLPPNKAAIYLNNLIKGLKLFQTSFDKYDRAIDLHGLSIENKNIENQLLQNWIAFETLLVGYSSKSKIDQVLDHLIPFLKYKYLNRTIYEFSRDLMRFDNIFFRAELKKISFGDNVQEKVAALISLEECKVNRSNLYKHLEKSPLLKWRLSQFHHHLGTSKTIREFIEIHEKKVEWQIKRMYRTRNLIVHTGTVPDYTETLVENSHFYLDLLLSTINDLSIKGNVIYSIEQAIEEVSIRVKKHNLGLKENSAINLNENNYRKLILGY